MQLSLTAWSLVFMYHVVRGQIESGCFSNESDPYSLFSTKTSYFQVDNEDTSVISLPGKKPKFSYGKR